MNQAKKESDYSWGSILLTVPLVAAAHLAFIGVVVLGLEVLKILLGFVGYFLRLIPFGTTVVWFIAQGILLCLLLWTLLGLGCVLCAIVTPSAAAQNRNPELCGGDDENKTTWLQWVALLTPLSLTVFFLLKFWISKI